MASKFSRKYKVYKPTPSGPPTERICKRVKCEDDTTTPPTPPNPTP
jgi:hypothetical protein